MSLTAYTPKFRALDAANDRWNITPLPEPEQAWHDRLMAALRRLSAPTTPDSVNVTTVRDWSKWRTIAYVEGICPICFGIGVPVDDGHGGVDYEPCPMCDPGLTNQRFDDIPF